MYRRIANKCSGNPKFHHGEQMFCKIRAASLENLSLEFPTRSDTNQAVQTQKIARGWKLHFFKDTHTFQNQDIYQKKPFSTNQWSGEYDSSKKN